MKNTIITVVNRSGTIEKTATDKFHAEAMLKQLNNVFKGVDTFTISLKCVDNWAINYDR